MHHSINLLYNECRLSAVIGCNYQIKFIINCADSYSSFFFSHLHFRRTHHLHQRCDVETCLELIRISRAGQKR